MTAPPAKNIEPAALLEVARHRYLNYALSVITARALPDVRDGLKPVQRRIMYAMYNNLRLLPDSRYRKSAAVVGEVMAKLHPHGDSSIYDALVRMAQPFSLLHPLVDGQGNFGSLDGDNAAAMRYTECRLRPLAIELLSEIKRNTVDFRPNYDGQFSEPVVLPAQFPQLLVNGCEGIAVGMATRIPPHNLREIIDGCFLLIENPSADTQALCQKIRGPDFPTGGVILNSREDLVGIYEAGRGSLKLQGRWNSEKEGRKSRMVITEIPYAVNKASLVEKIGALIAARKVPQLVDVRDESTDVVRIVLDLRRAGDGEAAMAYLLRHTPLQSNFHLNLTCLLPSPDSDICSPQRCDLATVLRHWLDFRYQTIQRRFTFDLEQLLKRIHILEGLAIIFDALDEAIRIIRGSEGRRDAGERLMARFEIDDIQADAILDLRLYHLARMQIAAVLEELNEKRLAAAAMEAILNSEERLWAQVRDELRELRKLYGHKRRTTIKSQPLPQPDYDENAYIISETTFLIVSRDGWFKRQTRFSDVSKIRIREGDGLGWIAQAQTTSTVTFFTDRGSAFVCRLDSIPATAGYGEPVQSHFNFQDGERLVGVIVHDPLALPPLPAPAPESEGTDELPPPYGIAVTRLGRTMRFMLSSHKEPSTRNGRRFARISEQSDGVVAVWPSTGEEMVSVASRNTRALCFPVNQVKIVRGASKGVMAINLDSGDFVMAFELTTKPFGGARVVASTGREELIRPRKFSSSRGGRGRALLKRARFVRWITEPVRYDQCYRPANVAQQAGSTTTPKASEDN